MGRFYFFQSPFFPWKNFIQLAGVETSKHLTWTQKNKGLWLNVSFPGGSVVKNPPAMQETRFNPCVGKIPWRRKWLPTPVFLPGESLGQRSLVGYSPWGHKSWRWLNNRAVTLLNIVIICTVILFFFPIGFKSLEVQSLA